MKTNTCRCGAENTLQAKKCWNCGRSLRTEGLMALVVLILIIVYVNFFTGDKTTTTENNTTTEKVQTK
jgi:hypothetical protein